jgi:signal peptidase I
MLGSDPLAGAEPSVTHPRPRSRFRNLTGGFWFHLLAAVLALALLQAFVVKLYVVPSGSMEHTLEVGDRILVDRVAFRVSEPEPGDVVVFTGSSLWGPPPAAPSNPLVYGMKWIGGLVGIGPDLDRVLVKRIVAVPGQTVSCCDTSGRVAVDGISIDEPYVSGDPPFAAGALDCSTVPQSKRCFEPVTVPSEVYFVLGDHRGVSDDSVAGCRGGAPLPNCLKFVRRADLVGRVAVIVWPGMRWRLV